MFWIAGPEAGHWLVTSFVVLLLGTMPEGLKYQMDHHWGGFTAWDLIMPLFLFIVGAAMPFSLGRRIDAGDVGGLGLFGDVFGGGLGLFEGAGGDADVSSGGG